MRDILSVPIKRPLLAESGHPRELWARIAGFDPKQSMSPFAVAISVDDQLRMHGAALRNHRTSDNDWLFECHRLSMSRNFRRIVHFAEAGSSRYNY